VQQALRGILLFPAQAAALPGAVHLKPPLPLSPLLPIPPSAVAPSPVHPFTPAAVDPLTGALAHPLTPSAVDQRSVLMLTRLQAGDHAPEVMEWLRGLPKEQVVSLLEKTPWRKDDHAVCDALVQTLLDTHRLALEKADELPPLCALRVAQSLGSRGDKRCEPVFERLLEQHRTNEALAVPAVLAFAEYYRFIGDYAKSAETFLRVKGYTKASSTLANCTVEAARAYMQAGNEAEAERLYGQVAQYGYGWATGVAAIDHANLLLERGLHDEARRLLSAPVSGQYADQIRPVMLQCLGRSYYLTGDFAPARDCSRRAIEQYRSLETPLQREGLEASLGGAQACLGWMSRWEENAIWTDANKLLLLSTGPGRTGRSRFFVHTWREVPIEFVARPDWIRAKVAEVSRTNYSSRYRVEVELAGGAPIGQLDGKLSVTSPKHPKDAIVVPFHISRKGRLRWSGASAFFGFLKAGHSAEMTVRVESPEPFKVLGASCDSEWLRASGTAKGGDRRVWEITVVADAATHAHGILAGVARVRTDVQGEEVMELPCYAHVTAH